MDYATRNALIVGIAMGFAVIPSIYSLAEDALADVPLSMMEGAQALGPAAGRRYGKSRYRRRDRASFLQ